MSSDIDIAIVVIFLLLNLGVGLYYGRGVSNFSDYAVGKRDFSTTAIVSTIVATAVSGSLFMIGLSRIYSHGFYYLISLLGVVVALFLISSLIVPRMKHFMNSLSIADVLGNLYGKHVRIIVAICAVIVNFGTIAVQYKVFGSVINYFIGTDTTLAVIVTGVVITFYSAFGGIRSVTFTDIMQFTVFGTVIPLIGIILWKSTIVTSSFSYEHVLENNNFDLIYVLDYRNPGFWPMLALFLYFAFPSPSPAQFQRIVIGQNIKQVKKAFAISAMILLIIILAIFWIGLLLFTLNPNLDPNALIPYIIDNYSYTGLKGLIIAGIMAMVMSSADSFINVASVLIINDICRPLKINIRHELFLTRIVATIVGLGPIYLALSNQDLLNIMLSANAFYMPIVIVPLLITILGFKTTKIAILSSMVSGFSTVVIWKIIGFKLDPIVPATLANFITMMLVHYIGKQKDGWTKPKIEEELEEENKLGVFASIYYSVRYFNFVKFIQKNSPRDETLYSFFGIFCFVSTLSTIYLTQRELLGVHGDLVTYLYGAMLVISTFFGLHMMWSDRIRNPLIMSVMWHIALIYNITFCSSFFLLLSHFHEVQIIVFILSLLVLFNLTRWKTALTIVVIGVSSGLLTYKLVISDFSIKELYQNYNLILYGLLIAAASLFSFSKPKEEYVDNAEDKIVVLSGEVDKLNFDMYQRDKEIDFLSSKVLHYETKVQSLNQQINSTQEEILSLKNEIRERKNKLALLTIEIQDSKRKFKELRNSTELNDQRCGELNSNIVAKEKLLKETQELLSLNRERLHNLKFAVTSKEATISRLGAEIAYSKDTIETLKAENKELDEKVKFFRERNDNHEKEIERLGETSQKILNNVTHELRLLVGNVMNFAEMLSEKIDALDKEQLKMLSKEVYQNSNRLSTMIMNMLDLATMDIKKVDLNKSTTNISFLIEERISRCRKIYLDGKPIRFETSIEPEMMIRVDVYYIQQVIDNIIINAIKFSTKGTIKVIGYSTSNEIFIIIEDEGIGIPKYDLYDIFTPFKMRSNTVSKAEGRGVGLALCKTAVEAHGGSITANSEGSGATFTITLPK